MHVTYNFKPKLGIQAARMVVYMTTKFRIHPIIAAAVAGAAAVTWSGFYCLCEGCSAAKKGALRQRLGIRASRRVV
jgi:hypothetical protein